MAMLIFTGALISGCATPNDDRVYEGDIVIKPQSFSITKMGVGDTIKGRATIINNSDNPKTYQCYYHRRNVVVEGWTEMPADYVEWLIFPKEDIIVPAQGMGQVDLGISIPSGIKIFAKQWWVEIGIGEVNDNFYQGGGAVTLWVTMR